MPFHVIEVHYQRFWDKDINRPTARGKVVQNRVIVIGNVFGRFNYERLIVRRNLLVFHSSSISTASSFSALKKQCNAHP